MADGRLFEASQPRADYEAERAVIGAVLLDGEGGWSVLPRVKAALTADDFADPRHGLIFTAMCAVAERGEHVDVLTVVAELRARDRLNTAGGAQYLGELTDEIPTVAHCESHARIVAEHALARRVEDRARDLTHVARNHGSTTADLIAGARRVLDTATAQAAASVLAPVGDAIDEELSRICADHDETVRPTGIAELDVALCGGLREGDLVIPGGRPSSGKSALGFQLAWSIASQGLPVIVVSLEMPRASVVQRIVAQRSGIDLGTIRARLFQSEIETNAYCKALDALRALPLLIVDDGAITPTRLRALCLIAKARSRGGRLGAVVFDYLQKARPDARGENREQEIAAIARSLKSLARELSCPVIAPAQLSRAVEGRDDDRPPRMSDFRGSGEIEQEADILIGIHRPAKAKHTRELWVLKQRNGPADDLKVDLAWDGPSARFVAPHAYTEQLPSHDACDAEGL
jgi:replicative DNA helicase